MKKKIACGTLIVSRREESVLLSLRSPHKTHQLTWSLWGGMLEGKEVPHECLERELLEEIGDHPPFETHPFDIYHSKDSSFIFYTFVSIVEEEFVPVLNNENAGYCWVKIGEWPRPLHFGIRKTFTSPVSIRKLKQLL